MTATVVNGVEVVADEPAPSPLSGTSKHPDRTIYMESIRSLLLADGSSIYGCIDCDYTSAKAGSVRAHRAKHAKKRNAETREAEKSLVAAEMDMPEIARIVEMVQGAKKLQEQLDAAERAHQAQVEKLTAERDTYRERAIKAERALSTLRQAFGALLPKDE